MGPLTLLVVATMWTSHAVAVSVTNGSLGLCHPDDFVIYEELFCLPKNYSR